MNRFNRTMALTRNAEYLNDYEKLKKLRSIDDRDGSKKADVWAKKMGGKWGEYPPPRPLPDYVNMYSKIFQGGYGDSSVEVVSSPISSPAELIIAAHADLEQKKKRNAKDINRKVGEPQKPKYLTLRIDVTASKKDIMAAVENQVTSWQNFVGKKKGRNRETDLSPWLIYDLYHKQGKNLLRITKEKFGIKDNPAYSNTTTALYEQVRRAFEKAEKMISETHPQTRL